MSDPWRNPTHPRKVRRSIFTQLMVFVHARNATVRAATAIRDHAASDGSLSCFQPPQGPQRGLAEKLVQKSRNKQLRDLFVDGFGIHHAGMLRQVGICS